jgi:hypothetical protein
MQLRKVLTEEEFEHEEREEGSLAILQTWVDAAIQHGWVELVKPKNLQKVKCIGNIFLVDKDEFPRVVYTSPKLNEIGDPSKYTLPSRFSHLYFPGEFFYKIDL